MLPASPPPLIDSFGRSITSLRISVTDKCNFRCIYCMPEEGIVPKPHDEILRYEEIAEIVREAAGLGIVKIKITGGEPLVKRNIVSLVARIAAIPGISDLGMTTNGSLLTLEKARTIRNAGLMRLNVSLDTLDPARFAAITRGADIGAVLAGIDAALEAGLSPVKINTVIMEETTHAEIERLRRFCVSKGLMMQTIAHFSLNDRSSGAGIPADRPPPCAQCNRLRLTADGFLKPCLFSEFEVKVDFNDIRGSLLAAVGAKPQEGRSCGNRAMHQIGG